MRLGFKVMLRDGVYHLSGAFDEHAEFKQLLAAPRPLKMNLSGITSINSQGVRLHIKFMRDLGEDDVEFLECPDSVVEMFNTFPSSLGYPQRPKRVASLWVGYFCKGCGRDFGMLLGRNDFERCTQRFPEKRCPRCSNLLEARGEPGDVLLFLRCLD